MEQEHPLDPGNVLHLLHGDAEIPGAQHFIVVRDSLISGPSDVSPIPHARKRREFWTEFEGCLLPPERSEENLDRLNREVFGAHELGAALNISPEDRPVVIWTTRTWPDRLFLWWVFDAIERQRLERSRFWVAESSSRVAIDSDVADPWGFGKHGPDSLSAAFSSATPLSEELLQTGARLWREYAGESPLPLDDSRRRGQRPFPDLASVAET
ncbi:MAG: hypothetical protein AAF517_11540, partial [Planctomycetota bacterium]